MNIRYIVPIILISLNLFSQNKTIVPASGAIVFNAKVTITDQNLYDASKKAFMRKLLAGTVESEIKQQKALGREVDTARFNAQFESEASGIFSFFESELFRDEDGLKYHHDYKGGMITQYKSNNNGQQDVVIIDSKTRNFTNDATEGVYDYSGNAIHDIKVLKDQIKMIRNYKCFKIMYTYSENGHAGDDTGFSAFMSNYKTTREM